MGVLCLTLEDFLHPAAWRVFYDCYRVSTVNALVAVNTCLSACWLFRGDCAEYLPFTRTLPVNTDPAGYGGSGRLSVRLLQTPSAVKAFLFVVNGRLVGVRGTHQPSAHALGSQANLRPICFAQKRYEPIREVLIDLWLIL